MEVQVGHRRDLAFAVACIVLASVVAGHIWIDELIGWVQGFITNVIVPRFGLDLFF